MTRFYGFTPEYQRGMAAKTWMLYLRAMSPITAMEQMAQLSVTHSAEPDKFFRRLRRMAFGFFGGVPGKKKGSRKAQGAQDGEPITQQIAPFLAHPQLRKYVTIRKKSPEEAK